MSENFDSWLRTHSLIICLPRGRWSLEHRLKASTPSSPQDFQFLPKQCKVSSLEKGTSEILGLLAPIANVWKNSSQVSCHTKVPSAKGAKGMASHPARFKLQCQTRPYYWPTSMPVTRALKNKMRAHRPWTWSLPRNVSCARNTDRDDTSKVEGNWTKLFVFHKRSCLYASCGTRRTRVWSTAILL